MLLPASGVCHCCPHEQGVAIGGMARTEGTVAGSGGEKAEGHLSQGEEWKLHGDTAGLARSQGFHRELRGVELPIHQRSRRRGPPMRAARTTEQTQVRRVERLFRGADYFRGNFPASPLRLPVPKKSVLSWIDPMTGVSRAFSDLLTVTARGWVRRLIFSTRRYFAAFQMH